MKGQAGVDSNLNAFYRHLYRQGWLQSLFGLFIAIEIYIVFDSFFLAMLAAAMFVYVPLPEDTPKSRNINVLLSSGIMIILLFMAFVDSSTWGLGLENTGGLWPWNWNAQMIIFIGIWIFAFISCISGDVENRQYVGAILLISSSLIFALGIGSQEAGVAFFGDWWPTVHNTVSPVIDSIGKSLSGFQKTFGQAWLMLTDPVGYATSLMNGTHAYNPHGISGALGLEIEDFGIPSKVYAEQPVMISAVIDNKGAFDAENVKVGILIGDKGPRGLSTRDRILPSKTMSISSIIDVPTNCENNATSERICYKKDVPQKIAKLYKEQVIFTGKVDCDTIDIFDLRKKYIPLKLQVEYDYQSDSSLKLEFMSDREWQRLSREGKMQFKDVASEYSTAPVVFPIGTSGLKQPLNAKNEFHIGLRLDAEQKDSMVLAREMALAVPGDFERVGECTPKETRTITGKDNITLVWEWKGDNIIPGGKIIYCTFKLKKDAAIEPSRIYVVTAHANYRFIKWSEINAKVEFGSYCCPRTGLKENVLYGESDCPPGQVCCAYTQGSGGYCIPENQYSEKRCGKSAGGSDVAYLHNYCKNRVDYQKNHGWEDYYGCLLGMGECNENGECEEYGSNINADPSLWKNPTSYAHSINENLVCRKVRGYDIRACCYESIDDEQCRAAFEEWMRQAVPGSEYFENYPYPDEKAIHAAAGVN